MISKNTRSGNDRPATAAIELCSITHVDGQLFVTFSNGPDNWSLPVKAVDVQSFKKFQAKVADVLGSGLAMTAKMSVGRNVAQRNGIGPWKLPSIRGARNDQRNS